MGGSDPGDGFVASIPAEERIDVSKRQKRHPAQEPTGRRKRQCDCVGVAETCEETWVRWEKLAHCGGTEGLSPFGFTSSQPPSEFVRSQFIPNWGSRWCFSIFRYFFFCCSILWSPNDTPPIHILLFWPFLNCFQCSPEPKKKGWSNNHLLSHRPPKTNRKGQQEEIKRVFRKWSGPGITDKTWKSVIRISQTDKRLPTPRLAVGTLVRVRALWVEHVNLRWAKQKRKWREIKNVGREPPSCSVLIQWNKPRRRPLQF